MSKVMITALVCLLCVTSMRSASADCLPDSMFYDLNDSQIPEGWSQRTMFGGPGVEDSAFRAYNIDGRAWLSRSGCLPPGATEIRFEYDASVSYSYWGMANRVRIILASTDSFFVTASVSEYVYGADILRARFGKNGDDVSFEEYPIDYGIFHFTATFSDGKMTFKAVAHSDGSTLFDLNYTDESIVINELEEIEFLVSTTTLNNNWMDNLLVKTSGTTVIDTFFAALDIKSNSCPNPLNAGKGNSEFWVYVDDEFDISSSGASSDALAKAHSGKRRGVLPVAILGTDDFDVSEIDVASVMLEGVPFLRHNYEDVSTPVPDDAGECECTDIGPDGFIDLTMKFDKNAIINEIGEVNVGDVIPLTLTGELLDGTPIEGVDCVVIVGHGGPQYSQSGESQFELANYPNPFNPTTEISFNLPVMSNVRLDVYNIVGQKVTTLVDGPMQPGPHSVTWNGMSDSGEPIASGMYFYRLEAGNYSESRKMLLLK